MISSSQRPLPDNTQHSQQTNIHAHGGIQIHSLSRRATADLRLRHRSHWDRRHSVGDQFPPAQNSVWYYSSLYFYLYTFRYQKKMRNILNQMESSTCRIHYHCNFLVDEISSWSQRSVFGIATRLRSGQQRIRSYIHAGKKVFIIFRPSKTYRGALCLLLSGHRWLLPRDKATRAWSWPPICFFDEVKNELKYTATHTHTFVACTGKSVRLYQIYRHSHTCLHSMYREECASLSNILPLAHMPS